MTPRERLDRALNHAVASPAQWDTVEPETRERLEFVAGFLRNRACARLLMACLLAKLDRPEVDPRKPYTEIGSADCFSGRTYDERYLTAFLREHRLPCNPTTAFLTPTLRNIALPLTRNVALVGRPRKLYDDTILVLEGVAEGREEAEAVLVDVLRILVRLRDEQRRRLESLQEALKGTAADLPLSSEAILRLIQQHLNCANASRLPVLIVAAAYASVAEKIGERCKPLLGHNAADKQTGATGDIEILVSDDEQVRTVYEMKSKPVTVGDIETAVEKVACAEGGIDNYIFITTAAVDAKVAEYASRLYESTGGIEFAILDCVGFLRHFLHLFHRRRSQFVVEYQALLMAEPESAVSMALKEVFLTLRQQAEVDAG